VLVISLSQCVINFFLLRLGRAPTHIERAVWLHQSCQLVLRRIGFGLRVVGGPPASGLLVSNHLSYLDIMLYGATMPCVFVSKTEVRSWPIVGLLAALGGTVFIDRQSTVSATAAAARIEQLLAAGVLVLIFPEGTSSDGVSVLRFFPFLFEPAVRQAAMVTSAAIAYAAPDVPESSLCYYGDIAFAPHLLETMQFDAVWGTIRFAQSGNIYTDRKRAAAETQQQVTALRAEHRASVQQLAERP
jgi:1-acyl-sn-glycerol-3-phosphate acyltransferase